MLETNDPSSQGNRDLETTDIINSKDETLSSPVTPQDLPEFGLERVYQKKKLLHLQEITEETDEKALQVEFKQTLWGHENTL